MAIKAAKAQGTSGESIAWVIVFYAIKDNKKTGFVKNEAGL
jgi:hypothetical protein